MSSSSSTTTTTTPVTTAVKRGRGRPPKSAVADDDDDRSFILPPRSAKKQRRSNDDSSDDESSDEDDEVLLTSFSNTRALVPVAQVLTIPTFAGKHMWFQTTQVAHMATLFKTLEKMMDAAEIVFHPEGWRIIALNGKRTGLISLRVTEHTLDEGIYECDTMYRVFVSMQDLSFHLRMFRRYHAMSICIEGQEHDVDEIRLRFTQGTEQDAEARMKCREPEIDQIRCPPITYFNQVDLPADAFKEVINSFKNDNMITEVTFKKTADRFTISVMRDRLPISVSFKPDISSPDAPRFFSAKTNADGQTVLTQQDTANPVAASEHDKAERSATFHMSEIVAITTITKASKWVSLNMPEPHQNIKKPLKITYSIAALGELSFYLTEKLMIEDGGEDNNDDDGDKDDDKKKDNLASSSSSTSSSSLGK